MAWSPEQIPIAEVEFPDDESMRISLRRSTRRSTFRVVVR